MGQFEKGGLIFDFQKTLDFQANGQALTWRWVW